MITNYNYVTNQLQKWYSEEEYNALKEKEKKDESDNIRIRNSDVNNNANQFTMGG